MLEKLQDDLKRYQYVEKAALTDEEVATLKEMFKVEGAFKALFRHLCIIDSDRGTQMAYGMEEIPTAGNYTDREIADLVRFKNMTTQHVRGRMEALRNTFELEASKAVEAEEKRLKEEQEKNDKAQKERDIEAKGVHPDM